MESELYLVSQNVDVEQLPNIFLSLVSIETFLCGEALSDFGKLDLNPFGFRFLILTGPNIRDELIEATHVGAGGQPKHFKN